MVRIRIGSGSLTIPRNEIAEIVELHDQPPAATLTSSIAQNPESYLLQAARMQGIDEAFVRSVAKVESGLRPNALSAKGARGLMQLMPATAAQLRVDPGQAQSNALGGAMYLRQMLLRFKGDSALALAAYNAGPGAVAKYGGIPPYAETRNYILRVLAEYKAQRHSNVHSMGIAGAQAHTGAGN